MAITNGYCTLNEVKAACRITDNNDDTLLENCIESASRRIDGFCNRFFYQRTATSVLLYAGNLYFVTVPDLVSVTTLATDNAGDGTFSTVWSATDYQLEPLDRGLQSRPATAVRAVAGKSFPLFAVPRRPGVQITGTWGWSAIPDDIRDACVLLAMRHYARFNSPLGVAGFGEMGAVTVRAVDPDVRDLLAPYVAMTVA